MAAAPRRKRDRSGRLQRCAAVDAPISRLRLTLSTLWRLELVALAWPVGRGSNGAPVRGSNGDPASGGAASWWRSRFNFSVQIAGLVCRIDIPFRARHPGVPAGDADLVVAEAAAETPGCRNSGDPGSGAAASPGGTVALRRLGNYLPPSSRRSPCCGARASQPVSGAARAVVPSEQRTKRLVTRVDLSRPWLPAYCCPLPRGC